MKLLKLGWVLGVKYLDKLREKEKRKLETWDYFISEAKQLVEQWKAKAAKKQRHRVSFEDHASETHPDAKQLKKTNNYL
jgi:hypothetical protein